MRREAESADLVAHSLLPFRFDRQLIDQRGDRRRERVMRRHHQEAHVVDDIGGGKQRPVFVACPAKLGEQIVPALRAGKRDPAREIVDHEGAPVDATTHLGAGQRRADRRNRGRDHVDERPVDGMHLRPDLPAEKRGRREIEGELLDGRIKLHLTPARPLCDPHRDPGIKFFEVGLHRSGLEGDRERAPMQAVFIEIAEHQSAWKQTVEDYGPPEFRGEILLRVEHYELVCVGPEQRNIGLAEYAGTIHEAVALDPPLDEPLRVRKDAQRVADERPTFVARNMRKRTARGRLYLLGLSGRISRHLCFSSSDARLS
jgi:hypothetical protein